MPLPLKTFVEENIQPLDVAIEHTGFVQQLLINQQRVSLQLYDLKSLEGDLSQANTLLLPLVMPLDFAWIEEAKSLCKQHSSKYILWDLSDSLNLSEEHFELFSKSLWNPHCDRSLGVILYRGEAPALDQPGLDQPGLNQEVFDALHWSLSQLPEKALPFLLLKLQGETPGKLFQQLSPEDFLPFYYLFQGTTNPSFPYALPHLSLGASLSPLAGSIPSQRIPLLLLVNESLPSAKIDALCQILVAQNRLFRVAAEHSFTTQWDGADFCIVHSQYITPQGKRKLLGFCAAGGTIVTVGAKMGVPQELSLAEWITSHQSA